MAQVIRCPICNDLIALRFDGARCYKCGKTFEISNQPQERLLAERKEDAQHGFKWLSFILFWFFAFCFGFVAEYLKLPFDRQWTLIGVFFAALIVSLSLSYLIFKFDNSNTRH